MPALVLTPTPAKYVCIVRSLPEQVSSPLQVIRISCNILKTRVFPLRAEHSPLVITGLLNNNYRQPAQIADMTAPPHGGQAGDLLVQQIDGEYL